MKLDVGNIENFGKNMDLLTITKWVDTFGSLFQRLQKARRIQATRELLRHLIRLNSGLDEIVTNANVTIREFEALASSSITHRRSICDRIEALNKKQMNCFQTST